MNCISISGARENNLKSVSVDIPKNKFVLVTGVSGSGKSSLVQNVIANEGQRLYLSQFNPRARQYFGRISKPEADRISGLSPVVSLDQVSFSSNLRSTVGTLSELYDYLRLLFARYSDNGRGDKKRPSRSHFSFNQAEGACASCKGLGNEEYIDPLTFVINPARSVKEGALSLTTPTGYVIYSQVTIDVLESVCRAEGFELDKPWDELSDREKGVILYGSDKIRIPFGKHPLESRMRWSGITAKPRDEGYYRGMIPVMEEILGRDRNKNILKYTSSRKCRECKGKRLNADALRWKWGGKDIAEWSSMSVQGIGEELKRFSASGDLSQGESEIIRAVTDRTGIMVSLGVGYLALDRESTGLSQGEVKRIRLSTLLQKNLSGLVYTLDEPTAGLHPADHKNLLGIMRRICNLGNTLIVIDHKNIGFEFADYWIEMGPEAGYNGGKVIFAGDRQGLFKKKSFRESPTWSYLVGESLLRRKQILNPGQGWIKAWNLDLNNLNSIKPVFRARSLNVICGVSGAGKSSLLSGSLYPLLSGRRLDNPHSYVESDIEVNKVIWIDQKPIGRNSRSNPATYTKMFDRIRDLYGSLPEVKARGLDKSSFSFNVEGGRCPACKGAGKTEIGVSYLGTVEIACEACQGKRFKNEVLGISYRGKNITEVLEMEVDEALDFFSDQNKIHPYLKWLSGLGLGYLKIGQPSGTLSGGEAQRIKLATELVRPARGHAVYLLDEPTSGLHPKDVQVLIDAVDNLVENGNTLILVEHDPDIVMLSDWVVELGPGGGEAGGDIIFSGKPEELENLRTPMALAVRENEERRKNAESGMLLTSVEMPENSREIKLRGVRTNNLKDIDVDIPRDQITAVTGVSGSGKTSLVYDTLHNCSRFYFSQTFSTYIRTLLGGQQPGDIQSAEGILPTIAIGHKIRHDNPRSTVGTITGILHILRLLFSRFSVDSAGKRPSLLARQFSFNENSGACRNCGGLGEIMAADPDKLVSYPDKSLFEGAFSGTKAGRFFTGPEGQYMAILRSAGDYLNMEFYHPWKDLSVEEKDIVLRGTGNREYKVEWHFKRKNRSGIHRFRSVWKGILKLVEEEYIKREGTKRQAGLVQAMTRVTCPSCKGKRFNPERLKYTIDGKNIAEWLNLDVDAFLSSLKGFVDGSAINSFTPEEKAFISNSSREIISVLESLSALGTGYIQLDRSVSSLSSGEYQRARLAAQLGSELCGLLYILDEPSSALHPANLADLWNVFRKIRLRGNTLLFVDHNPLFYYKADRIIELGPGGGENGGRIVNVLNNEDNNLLHFKNLIALPRPVCRKAFNPDDQLFSMSGLKSNNLRIDRLEIPRGWICIAGVSGSGKSTLIGEIIKHLKNHPTSESLIAPANEVKNWQWYQNPLSGLGVFDLMRKDFCSQVENTDILPKPDFFLLNRSGGRCEACQGKGHKSISLDFLGESNLLCEDCEGTGYGQEARKYKAKEKGFSEFMEMTIQQLCSGNYFPSITDTLEKACEMGLGYLKAGQGSNTLSMGEMQRLALVKECASEKPGRNIFLFDEPGRGLHKNDSERFIDLISQLVGRGNTVIMVEHNPWIISICDWVVELGPGGGEMGGHVIYEGRPAGMAGDHETPTSSIMNKLWEKDM